MEPFLVLLLLAIAFVCSIVIPLHNFLVTALDEQDDGIVTVRKSAAKAKRILKDVDVQFISLVGAGANRKTIVYKGDGAEPNMTRTVMILKTDAAKKLIYGIVYSPDEVDAQGDTMSATEIEKAAHAFLQKGRTANVDKDHDEAPDEGYIVESYIIAKGDTRFPDEPEGSWAVVIKVTDEETWEQVEKGEITGISMQARAKAQKVSKQADDDAEGKTLIQKFKALLEQAGAAVTGRENPTASVTKDFKGNLQRRQLRDAVYALYSSLEKIVYDDSNEDPQAAINADVDAFLEYISTLNITKMEKQTTGGEEKVTKAADPETPEQVQLADLQKRLEALEAENAELKKSAPGRQSAEGRGGGEQQEEEVAKGLPIFRQF